jgi:beta-lactamase superfamily II metal-dependent hydrolase
MKVLGLLVMASLCSCLSIDPPQNPFEADASSHPHSGGAGTSSEDTLKIYTLDVEQGDATLIISPSGEVLLIDSGPPESGKNVILPAFTSLGITQLNWIIASHYDADHIGGLQEVLADKEFSPSDGVFDRGDVTTKDTPVYADYLEATQSLRHTLQPGMSFDLGGGATAEVIIVNGGNASIENEMSTGLLIQWGAFRYFTDGDLPEELESTIATQIGDIDVLHVSHHGSSTATPTDFLNTLMPEAAIISVGENNDYGHPSPSTLYRLQQAEVEIYRTDQMGSLLIETDGENYAISQAP